MGTSQSRADNLTGRVPPGDFPLIGVGAPGSGVSPVIGSMVGPHSPIMNAIPGRPRSESRSTSSSIPVPVGSYGRSGGALSSSLPRSAGPGFDAAAAAALAAGTSPLQSSVPMVGSLPGTFPGTPNTGPGVGSLGALAGSSVGGSAGAGGGGGAFAAMQRRRVPAVFRWTHGGHKVYVTGSFSLWKEKIPLTRSGEDFVTILNLPVGCHYYKYIVDDSWKYDHDQTTAMDNSGNINNFIEVCENGGWDDDENDPKDDNDLLYEMRSEMFTENKKNPPLLPPHLRYTPLNRATNQRSDYEGQLPIPQQVTLNHVYFSERPNVLAMGISIRFRERFTTVVLYKRNPEIQLGAPETADTPMDTRPDPRPVADLSSQCAIIGDL